MCLIVFAWDSHPKYKLILAANRDEFYDRPARSAEAWTDEEWPDIIAGRDMKGGGTWFGVNRSQKWGAVTNIRKPGMQKINAPSRGALVLNYLQEDEYAPFYLEKIDPVSEEYMGFNLLVGDANGIYTYSNELRTIDEIPQGIHGLSNSFMNSNWPKVNRAKDKLTRILEKEVIEPNALFDLLGDEQKAADHELPDTGISRELEQAASSIFIRTEVYGTRCSTLLLIDNSGNMHFYERSFKPGSKDILEEKSFNVEKVSSLETE